MIRKMMLAAAIVAAPVMLHAQAKLLRHPSLLEGQDRVQLSGRYLDRQ